MHIGVDHGPESCALLNHDSHKFDTLYIPVLFNMESDSDEDIENFDIFRDLDLDLMDVFTRSQRAELRRMARMHNLRTTSDFVRLFQQRRNERILKIHWLFGFFPLPNVDYALLWRRHRPADLVRSSMRFFVAITAAAVRLSRLFVYGIAVFQWLRDILQAVLIYSSMVTFSPNFFVDIETYIFRDSKDVLRPRNATSWIDNLPINDGSVFDWNLWLTLLRDMVSSTVRLQCSTDLVTKEQTCEIDRNALIFRFSDVVALHFPIFDRLPSIVLTILMMFIYVAYGFAGQMISFNVLFYFMMQVYNRLSSIIRFTTGIAKILWHNGADLIM